MKFHHKGPGVCARDAPACAPDVIKMSPSICNMFLLRVSLSGVQSQAAAGSIGAIRGAAQPHSSANSLNVEVQRNRIKQIYLYNIPCNARPCAPSGSNRCEGSREKASLPLLLPGRAVNGNGIPIPWSLLLIHNRPTAGLPGTSADMPASGHILLHAHTYRGGRMARAPSPMCTRALR